MSYLYEVFEVSAGDVMSYLQYDVFEVVSSVSVQQYELFQVVSLVTLQYEQIRMGAKLLGV